MAVELSSRDLVTTAASLVEQTSSTSRRAWIADILLSIVTTRKIKSLDRGFAQQRWLSWEWGDASFSEGNPAMMQGAYSSKSLIQASIRCLWSTQCSWSWTGRPTTTHWWRTTSINYFTAEPCSFWPNSNSIAMRDPLGRLLNYISSCTHAKCIYNPTINTEETR